MWINIISLGGVVYDIETGFPFNIINVVSGSSELIDNYVVASTTSMFLIFMKILQYFTFSKRLSAF